jgi:hypothetical protein
VTMHAAFYEPREYMARQQYDHAVAVLQLAEWIDPGNGAICFALARALIPLARIPDALRKLECAVDRRAVGPEALDASPDLATLRGRVEWPPLVERARRIAADSGARR